MTGSRRSPTTTKRPKARPATPKPETLYPSLREGPTPAERLATLQAEAKKRGIRPLTAEDFDRLMDSPSNWPVDEDMNEFLVWLRRLRREGRP
jgi:hypothetical protein